MLKSVAAIAPSLAGASATWDGLVRATLRHAADTPEWLAKASALAPHSPALLAAKGLIFMLLGRRELAQEATTLATEARVALNEMPSRHDGLMVCALESWVAGRPSRSAKIFDLVQREFPGDAFAAKMAQAIRFLYGDAAGMRRSAELAVANFGDDHPHAGYIHGCFAFACEEVGDLALAERVGARALELAPDDAWALHAVAHVHEMRGHPEKGRAWLAPRQSAFAHCSTFRHHVWWHYALFELELGAYDSVLALYDTEIRSESTDDYRDIANAVSLLARLEADGVDVGERWEELACLAEQRMNDGCIPFADLHYLLALLAAGRDAAADQLIARMASGADGSEFGAVAADCGAVAGGGLAAMRRGKHDEAFQGLIAARHALTKIGGSHAQRDVFERLTIDAALRAGRCDQARALVQERAQRRGAYDSFSMKRLGRCGPKIVTPPAAGAASF
ncbi:MAG: tetratricopeptide repeat protein [Pseudomonadota bacterium]